jgi:3',5'-cyclic AMP phosphodiesterase CpdA
MNKENITHPPRSLLNRRVALRHLSAGTLLTLGLWPGALRVAGNGQGGTFRFVVINDTHYLTNECGEYLHGAVEEMKKVNPDFCLHCGDLTDKGEAGHFGAVKEVFHGLRAPWYPVIGNHDYLTQSDGRAYVQAFPLRLNYYFRHRGWQFVGLDSSEGQRYEKTLIQPSTIRWLDDYLPRLSKTKPMVLFTHFPMGADVKYRPTNADVLLDRFREFNLIAVFCGHYHAFTERKAGSIVLTTNRCCSLKRGNHDNSKEKGYFVCTASEGAIAREFVEYKPAAKGTAQPAAS